MNKLENNSLSKRKSKKGHQREKLKRAKFYVENRFEFSIDEHINESKSEHLVDGFKQILNLTPSKSENDTCQILESFEVVDFDLSNNEPSEILTDTSFNISSDDEASHINGSVVEHFMNGNSFNSSVEIVSADLNVTSPVEIGKKKQTRIKKLILPDSDDEVIPELIPINAIIETTETEKTTKKKQTELLSPPKKKTIYKKSSTQLENTINFTEQEQLCYTDQGIIVILSEKQNVHFYGICLLSVLHGEVAILGHILNKNSPEIKIFSPRGSSLLYLKNVTKSDLQVTKYLQNLKISDKVQQTKACAVVLCQKVFDPEITFIEKHISQQILPKENSIFPRVSFQPNEGNFNLFTPNQDWENIISEMNHQSKMMICGGKGVGKTSFLRYAINKLLMKYNEVRMIDLDPGQSEFTIPGCISIVRVKSPIFGPNYTHLQATERSVLSNINIAYEPARYISAVKHLLNTDFDEIPTLVNYMGYTHGIGLNILSAVITCVQPSDILQIFSSNSKKNYKYLLEKDIVEEHAKLFVPELTQLNYTLRQIESMCDENEGWTAEPRQLREMCVLAYIRKMTDSESIFQSKAPLYRINLNDINLCDLKGDNIHPAAVNACLVALCIIENTDLNVFKVSGWGIVRGIDLGSNELVLLTAENFETLDQVTHLVLSNGVSLPPSLYMTPDDVEGAMPYVTEGVLLSFGQIPKRSRISIKSV